MSRRGAAAAPMSRRAEAVSLRRRLILLAVALTLPLLLIAALLGWQDRRTALREARQHDHQVIALLAARERDAVLRLRQGIAGIVASAGPLDAAGGCPRLRAGIAALLGQDAIGFAVFDAAGQQVCGAPALPHPSLAAAGFAIDLVPSTASRPGFVLASLTLHPAGTLAVALDPRWLTPETIAGAPAAWLQDAAGHDLAEEGLAEGAARGVLYQWLAFCALLLLALFGFLLGLQRLLFSPLQRLDAAVGGFQAGSPVDPRRLADAPREIAAVWRGFAETAAMLRQRERELHAAVIEQSLLLQETRHRVKNNLQIVTSLISLQAARIRQPEARAMLEATHGRIHALSTLHRHLYTRGGVREIDMREILQEICAQIFDSFGETMGGRLALAIEAPALRISSDEAVSLALIVSEIVTNAVKYAFPDGRAGRIAVVLTLTGTRLHLCIDDDGVGLGKAQHRAAAAHSADGIGLQLVRGFVRQFGGELTMSPMERAQTAGTRFDLRLDLHPPPSPPDFVERTAQHGG